MAVHSLRSNAKLLFTILGSVVTFIALEISADAQAEKTNKLCQVQEAPLPNHAVLRLGTTCFRAPGEIYALAFSPDGKLLAAGGREKYVQLFDARTGQRVHRLEAPNWYTTAVAFSPDSKRVAGYCFSNTPKLALWDVGTGKQQAVSPDEVIAWYFANVAFTPDNKHVLLSSWNLEVRSAATGKLVRRLPDNRSDYGNGGLAVTADGKTVAVGGYPNSRLFDLSSGKTLHNIEDDSGYGVRAAAFTPDGKVLALGSNGTVKLVTVSSGETRANFSFDDNAPGLNYVQYLAFANDGKTLVCHCHDGTVSLWNWANSKAASRCLVENATVATVSKDGNTLAIATGNAIRLWDLTTEKEKTPCESGHLRSVTELAFSADGLMLATADRDNTCVWRFPAGNLLHTVAVRGEGLAFSPDGKTLATGAQEGQLALVDVGTGRERQLETPLSVWSTRPLGFTADGKHFLATSRPDIGAGHVLDRWETATGRFLGRTASGGISARGVSLNANCTTLISQPVGRRPVQVMDLRSGKLRHELIESEDDYSPDAASYRIVDSGGLVLVQRKGGAGVWELDSARQAQVLPVAQLCVLSPDGRLAATTEDGGQITPDNPTPIRIWDLWAGREILQFQGSGTYVASLAFSPDGRLLASGLDDGTILVWDMAVPQAAIRQPGSKLTEAELDAIWKQLADPDPSQVYLALAKLAATPEQAIALLGQRLQPVPHGLQQQIQSLVQQLDSPKFNEREQATRRLASLREPFEDALWQALDADPSPEVSLRLQAILAPPLAQLPAETLQKLRAVRVLEWIGSDAAQALLMEMAMGAEGARETTAARAALIRLNE